MFSSPANIAFTVGNIDIHWYGIVMSISILFGLFVVLKLRKIFYNEITEDNVYDITFLLIIAGILGARLYYVILDYKFFINHPSEIFAIWNGGLSIQGAILGGIIAFYFYAKKKKFNFLKYADLFSFGLISGQIIGRWGNFFNSEAFGTPTNLPWKLYIPLTSRPQEYMSYEYFHPTFLYESVCNFVVLLILLILQYKLKTKKTGVIFFSYLLMYSIIRITIESIRIDSVLNIFGIPIAQICAFIFILISIFGILKINMKHSL